MTTRSLTITLVELVAAAAGTVILIRYLILPASLQSGLPPAGNEVAAPPTTKIMPQSLTRGVETFTGILSLENGATLKVETKVYPLLINKIDASNVLKAQGYKTGDEINVMGKTVKDIIEVAGINKLVR
ncbi:MAG: hypothetical protein AAB673_02340 [Patescibacteria group bacterium]